MLVIYSSELTNNAYKPKEFMDGDYELVEFSCPNGFYNIHSNNNNIPVQQVLPTVIQNVSLTKGFYTAEELRSHIESRLQSVIAGTFSVSYDSKTGKYTITDSTEFRFNDAAETGCLDVLGFDTGGDYATSQTSVRPVNMTPYEDIYIYISEDKIRNVVRSDTKHYSTFHIPLQQTDFGGLIRYRRQSDEPQHMRVSSERYLTFTFLDKNDKSIDFNDMDWKLVLTKK